MAGEGGGSWNPAVTVEDGVDKEIGGLGCQGPWLAGAGNSPPHSVRPGAAGCYAPPSRPPRA